MHFRFIDLIKIHSYRYLKLLLRKEGLNLHTTAEFEVVRTMKERACYLATNPQREESVDTERYSYVLPDGATVEVLGYFIGIWLIIILVK